MSVCIIYNLERLNYGALLRTHTSLHLKFYCHLCRRTDLLHNLFWASLLSNSIHDECVIAVFSPLYIATDSVHAKIYEYMCMVVSSIGLSSCVSILCVYICLCLITLPVFSGEQTLSFGAEMGHLNQN